MNIVHIGAASDPNRVNGINYVIWAIAAEQARAGHTVGVLLTGEPSASAEELSTAAGFQLLTVSQRWWTPRYRLLSLPVVSDFRPDVLHLHSAFSPMLVRICSEAIRLNIPYVLTPHGGLAPEELGRNRFKKSLYSALVERARFEKAHGITVLTSIEEYSVRSFAPRYLGPIMPIANPIDVEFSRAIRRGTIVTKSRPKLIYLGRLDVIQKGIDILFAIAGALPNIELHLYGEATARSKTSLPNLMRSKPKNVFLHDPVFGQQKAKVLSEADMYLQCSRWEGFSISIVEAMAAGLPIVISDTMNLAPLIESLDLGLVVPLEAEAAATMISDALENPAKLSAWSKTGRRHALEQFCGKKISAEYVNFYQQAISS